MNSKKDDALRPIYFDTETTGVNPEKDRIIEIAAFDPILNRSFQSFVNPQISIPKEASDINGITDDMVATAPLFSEAGKAFIEFCHGSVILIAHNSDQFDRHFLKNEGDRHSLTLPSWPMLDSLKWARKYRPDLPRHSLQFLRQIYGISENQAHRALDDVMVLYQVFSLMIDDLPFETVLSLMNEQKAGIAEITSDVMPFGKYKGKPFVEIPKSYFKWLSDQGAMDKPENHNLKASLQKAGVLC